MDYKLVVILANTTCSKGTGQLSGGVSRNSNTPESSLITHTVDDDDHRLTAELLVMDQGNHQLAMTTSKLRIAGDDESKKLNDLFFMSRRPVFTFSGHPFPSPPPPSPLCAACGMVDIITDRIIKNTIKILEL